jgi:hypothetical protein
MQHSLRHSLQVFYETRVFERCDGYYWQSMDGPERGPFLTMLLAVQDMQERDGPSRVGALTTDHDAGGEP